MLVIGLQVGGGVSPDRPLEILGSEAAAISVTDSDSREVDLGANLTEAIETPAARVLGVDEPSPLSPAQQYQTLPVPRPTAVSGVLASETADDGDPPASLLEPTATEQSQPAAAALEASPTPLPPTATAIPATAIPATATPLPPTATPTATATPPATATPIPTDTPVPPTATATPSPTPTPIPATATPREDRNGEEPELLNGIVTFYWEELAGLPMGCQPYAPYDPTDWTIIAVGPDHYEEWPCGQIFEVCGEAGCIQGFRQDSCPGCGENHLDLSRAGVLLVCGQDIHTCAVTIRVVD